MTSCEGGKRHTWTTLVRDRKGRIKCDCGTRVARLIGNRLDFATKADAAPIAVKHIYDMTIEEF